MHERDDSSVIQGDFELVTTPEALGQVLVAVEAHPLAAIDTEADSMHHYQEKLCLLQLTVEDRHWILDPLDDRLDLTPLIELLARRSLILHGADYDLRLLHRAYRFQPDTLFDTMLAAQLLGWPEVGLAAVVERVCGVALDKHGQRADWSIRPLTGELLTYAADDTRYLHRVAEAQMDQLRELDRLWWLGESCERQLAITRNAPPAEDPEEADGESTAWRIKGGRHLKGRSAAVLRELWHWRDAIARRLDRPAFKVASNALLLDFANFIAENPKAAWDDLPERPVWLRGRRRTGFDQALERALALPAAEWPRPPARHGRGQRMTAEDEALLKSLMQARDAVAGQLQIHPGVLGPRDALKQLVQTGAGTEKELCQQSGLMRWQAHCLAPALLPLLNGRAEGIPLPSPAATS